MRPLFVQGWGWGGGHGGLWKPAEPGLCWREGGGAPLEIPSPLAIDRKPGLLGNKSHLGQNVSIFPEKCYYLTAGEKKVMIADC